jgi:hypothetical protein
LLWVGSAPELHGGVGAYCAVAALAPEVVPVPDGAPVPVVFQEVWYQAVRTDGSMPMVTGNP